MNYQVRFLTITGPSKNRIKKIKFFKTIICSDVKIYNLLDFTYKVIVLPVLQKYNTAKNTKISPNFLVWKFCRKA